MHTILGAGGPVANALTALLISNNHPVKLGSRKPVTKSDKAEWVHTDLLDKASVLNISKSSSVIYLTAGLQYSSKIWAAEWPVIMNNIIIAGKESGARIIFFDNVYGYGHVTGSMTENTPYCPASVKGTIRAKIAEQLMNESSKGKINATIARAADFYGSASMNSFFDAMVIQKYAQAKKAMWLGDPARRHSLTYVPDAGNAIYLLGQNEWTGNNVWHMPTAPALTGKELIEISARAFGREPKYSAINKFMLKMVGLFQPVIGETAELYYQYKYDYIFDSSKFNKAFDIQPTSYHAGIGEFANMLSAK